MAERADLKSKEFQHKIELKLIYKIIPIIKVTENIYRTEFFWRYNWANKKINDLEVLEIPCGLGWGTRLLRSAKRVYAIDIDFPSVLKASKIIRKRNKKFFVGDMCFLPFPDGNVDAICCLEGIEHINKESGQKFIDECYRVLKPKGKLLISSPFDIRGTHSGNPYHLHEYQPGELEILFGNRFNINELVPRHLDNLVIQYFMCSKN